MQPALARVVQGMRQAPRAALLGLSGVVSLAWWAIPTRVPQLADDPGFPAAVAELVREPDDFVVVWPPQAADALEHLPPSLRAADAVPSATPERRRERSIAVLGPAGFSVPPGLASLDEGVVTAEPRRRFGDLEVGRFRFAQRPRLVFDLAADLKDVQVTLGGPEGVLRCDQRQEADWRCPGRPEWNHVGPTEIEVDGANWPCVWAHPVEGHELVLDLGERALGDVLELEAALSDGAARTPGAASVELTLELVPTPSGPGTGAVQTRTLSIPNAPGIRRLRLEWAGGRGHVRLLERTAHDGRRHLGVNLRVLERPLDRTRPGAAAAQLPEKTTESPGPGLPQPSAGSSDPGAASPAAPQALPEGQEGGTPGSPSPRPIPTGTP